MIILHGSRMEQFDKAVRLRKESTELFNYIWKHYSLYASFEYLMLAALFLGPLILLIFKIDKRKIFLIGFYGYSVHMTSYYINLIGVNMGAWNYPIQLIPSLPSFTFDSSLVPVTYMLMYQWTLNKKKNYYTYALLISIFFSFIFEPLLVSMELLKLYAGFNYIHRFFVYAIVSLLTKLLTDSFLWLQKKKGKPA